MSCWGVLTKERGPTGPSILAVVVAVVGLTPFPRVARPAVAPGIPLLIYNALPSILTAQFTAVICSKSTHTELQQPQLHSVARQNLASNTATVWISVSEGQNTTFQDGESKISLLFPQWQKNPTHLEDHKPWRSCQELWSWWELLHGPGMLASLRSKLMIVWTLVWSNNS